MNRTFYCTDSGIVQALGPAIDWSQYEVIPYGEEEDREKRRRAATARFERVCRDAALSAKMDRAVELLERIKAARSRPIPDDENAGPSVAELAGMYQSPSAFEMDRLRKAAEDETQRCREAEAAYAARNPHKRQEDLAGWPANPAERVEGRMGGRV